jgi:hypothetical protein
MRQLQPRARLTSCVDSEISEILGHTQIESTVGYLGIEVEDALAIAEQVDV